MDDFNTEENNNLMEQDWYQMGELYSIQYGDNSPQLPDDEIDVKDIVEF